MTTNNLLFWAGIATNYCIDEITAMNKIVDLEQTVKLQYKISTKRKTL